MADQLKWGKPSLEARIAALEASPGGGGQTLTIADDEDVTVAANPGTTLVLYTAITDARVVHLPPASSDPMTVIVKDVNGQAGIDGASVTLAPDGDDTIQGPWFFIVNGAQLDTGIVVAYANDGVSAWTLINDLSNVATATTLYLLAALNMLTAAGAVTPPSGGSTVDTQARTAIAALIAAFIS